MLFSALWIVLCAITLRTVFHYLLSLALSFDTYLLFLNLEWHKGLTSNTSKVAAEHSNVSLNIDTKWYKAHSSWPFCHSREWSAMCVPVSFSLLLCDCNEALWNNFYAGNGERVSNNYVFAVFIPLLILSRPDTLQEKRMVLLCTKTVTQQM